MGTQPQQKKALGLGEKWARSHDKTVKKKPSTKNTWHTTKGAKDSLKITAKGVSQKFRI